MLSEPGTFSKNPKTWGYEEDLRVLSADGVNLTLSDNQTYLTWTSLASSLLGYKSIQLDPIQTACFPHYLEDRVAEKIVSVIGSRIPGWDKENLSVRFGLTGTDATTMAIRLARAITGRTRIISFKGHYHGWADWSVSRTPPALGIPGYSHLESPFSTSTWARISEIEWGNVQQLWEATSRIYTMEEVAAVIFEHPLEAADLEWYAALRETCDRAGALLIADEVATGLRYSVGGACEFYGIKPDLICLGKALGNGYPISALVGPDDYMKLFSGENPVFCSSTHWGHSLGLNVANMILDIWNDECVKHLYMIGNRLRTDLGETGYSTTGNGVRFIIDLNENEQKYFLKRMRGKKILINRPITPTLSHTNGHVATTTKAAKAVKEDLLSMSEERLAKAVEDIEMKVLFRNR